MRWHPRAGASPPGGCVRGRNKWISPEVYIEECPLCALEENSFAIFPRGVDDWYNVGKVGAQPINCLLYFMENCVSLEGRKVKVGEGSVRFLESSGD